MRRPPIACQRAVQILHSPSVQHLWISEDQLSIVINRFFRTTCLHQKRHGSNVPGPLEARRRAAKRRMTISAGFYPQDNSPSPFSLRGLFGFRRKTVPTWQYQPPSLRRDATPADDSPNTTEATWTPTPNSTLESADPTSTQAPTAHTLVSSHEVAQTTRVDLKKNGGQIVVEDEIQACADLSAVTRDEPSRAESVDIEACFGLFKSKIALATTSHRDADLKAAFESSCPPCANVWEYNVMVFKYLLDRGWDPTSLLVLAEDVSSMFTLPPTYSPAHEELVDCFEKTLVAFPNRIRRMRSLIQRLAEAAVGAGTSRNSVQDDSLIALCRQLWQVSKPPGTKMGDKVREVICTVASKVRNPNTAIALRSFLFENDGQVETRSALMHLVSYASTGRNPYLAAADVLRCMPLSMRLHVIPMFTDHLSRASSKIVSPMLTQRERWTTWLSLICLAGKDTASAVTYLDAAIDPLVKATFYNDPRRNPARRSPDYIRLKNLLHALLIKFTKQDAALAALKTSMVRVLDSTFRSISTQWETQQPEALVVIAVLSLREAGLPHIMLVDAIATLLAQCDNFNALAKFMVVLRDRKVFLRETSKVRAAVQRKLLELQPQTGSSTIVPLQYHARTLRNCQTITSILEKITHFSTIKDTRLSTDKYEDITSTTSVTPEAHQRVAQQQEALRREALRQAAVRQTQHILDRASDACALPLALRQLSADMTMDHRVTLIHQLAHQYSIDNTRTHREAWRALYYLYRHLLEQSAAIGPLFSRAVVRTAIIRPMSEHRFVSARRLIWVCHLVARVEGEEVAKKIESDFWQWRGNLIKHAKQVHDSIGADRREKAHVGTMKRLGII